MLKVIIIILLLCKVFFILFKWKILIFIHYFYEGVAGNYY